MVDWLDLRVIALRRNQIHLTNQQSNAQYAATDKAVLKIERKRKLTVGNRFGVK